MYIPPQVEHDAHVFDMEDQHKIEELVGYKFRNRKLLMQAFTHASMVNTNSPCYQRIEFLGDAVLEVRPLQEQLTVADGGQTFIQKVSSARSASSHQSQMRYHYKSFSIKFMRQDWLASIYSIFQCFVTRCDCELCHMPRRPQVDQRKERVLA
jgi:hypothetical protein